MMSDTVYWQQLQQACKRGEREQHGRKFHYVVCHVCHDYMMNARYSLAMGSNYELKDERIESALAFTKQVEKELPNSEYSKTAVDLREKLEKEKKAFVIVKKQNEERIALFTERQKKLADQQKLKTKNNEQIKDQMDNEKQAKQMQRDSAVLQTPPPAATFKIQR